MGGAEVELGATVAKREDDAVPGGDEENEEKAKGEEANDDAAPPTPMRILMPLLAAAAPLRCSTCSDAHRSVVLSNILVGLSSVRRELNEVDCFSLLSRPMLLA